MITLTTLTKRDASRYRRIVPIAVLGTLVSTAGPLTAEPLLAVTTANALVRFDSTAPGATSSVALTGTGGEQILGIDVRPATGQLYGVGSASNLFVIDVATGAATLVGALGTTLNGTSFGVDFNPVVDRLRVTSDSDQNLRINPTMPGGAGTIVDGPLAFAAADVNFGTNPNVVGAAYRNSVAGATTTALFEIDSSLDILVEQNPANAGTLLTRGPLGLNAPAVLGFDISGRTGLAYAAWAAAGGPSNLYAINLNTGAASLIGPVGLAAGQQVRGLAVAQVPEPALLATVVLGLLATARRRRAATRGC